MGFGRGFVLAEPAEVVMVGIQASASAWDELANIAQVPSGLSGWGEEAASAQVGTAVEVE